MIDSDLRLKEAFSNVSTSSLWIADQCLKELKNLRIRESQCKLLATAPCAKRTLRNFVENVVGYPGMQIIFPAYFDEVWDFINQDNGVVSFLDYNAKVVTARVADIQKEPYPLPSTFINPHIGLTSSGYFVRLSAVTSLTTIYDKWIGLIDKFLSFYR